MKTRTITYTEPELKDCEPDLATMLTDAKSLEEASEMRWLESMLLLLGPQNRIGAWARKTMREKGWREAYKQLADYTANGYGVRG